MIIKTFANQATLTQQGECLTEVFRHPMPMKGASISSPFSFGFASRWPPSKELFRGCRAHFNRLVKVGEIGVRANGWRCWQKAIGAREKPSVGKEAYRAPNSHDHR